MKKVTLSVLVSVAMMVSASSAFAASDTGNTSVNVIKPITIVETQAMDLGVAVVGDTVSVAKGTSGAQANGSSKPGTTGVRGEFDVDGAAGASYVMTHDANTALSNGDVVTLDCGTNAGAGALAGSLNGTGDDVVACGGSVTVSTVGLHTGTYQVTANY